ncbi:MAG TPA: alpha/beta hydrolase [Bryobacteraceae bacterium]|nr:alpha/beta hydrolase [Bryobacteraceae bacterium]
MTGSLIFRCYDKEQLDRQYNNRRRFPHYEGVFKTWREWSAETRVHRSAELDLAYGPEPSQRLDVFHAAKPGAPIYVFLHGGYWQSLDKADYSFIAEGMAPNGVMTVIPNFALAPHFGMDEIVRQTRAAIAWLWTHGRDHGGDPARLYVGGHSAGGHLATMLLATNWPEFGARLPRDLVKGVCAISALFDMEPIRLCYLNDTLGMTRAVAERNDPLHQHYPVAAPLTIVLGDDESEEYYRQAVAMASRWSKLGYPLEMWLEQGRDHFDVVNDLRNPAADLVRAQLRHLV